MKAEIKTTITARLDPDVIAWLKSEALRKGIPYQTLMNSVLKEAKSGGGPQVEIIRRVIREELDRK